jgi:hypothetical protein
MDVIAGRRGYGTRLRAADHELVAVTLLPITEDLSRNGEVEGHDVRDRK